MSDGSFIITRVTGILIVLPPSLAHGTGQQPVEGLQTHLIPKQYLHSSLIPSFSPFQHPPIPPPIINPQPHTPNAHEEKQSSIHPMTSRISLRRLVGFIDPDSCDLAWTAEDADVDCYCETNRARCMEVR